MVRNLMILMLLFFTAGCGVREREKALEQQAANLAQKEQELLLREKTLQIRQEELDKRLQSLDSIQADTTQRVIPEIVGKWNVKMTCTEASCPGSAVGDIKNEIWQFGYLNKNLVVRAMSGNKLVRVYTGSVTNSIIELKDEVEVTGNTPATQILARLTVTNTGTMEGIREIERIGECKIVYSLQLSKQ